MELRQLETFVRVAELRSFTQAAELLYLTQPAVTRQVAALEAQLKTRLFDRLGRTVQLTAAGESLYRYAVEMLRLGREAERAVGDVVTGTAGRLAIGANSTTATYLLPPLLRQFRESYPGRYCPPRPLPRCLPSRLLPPPDKEDRSCTSL